MKIIKFFKPDDQYGFLSNWYSSNFTINNILFANIEQYMMYMKAVIFQDHEKQQSILLTNDPKIIKSLGREVRNYDDTIWNGIRQLIVYQALKEKFSQNDDIRYRLLSTENAILAEASPFDRIWGIGLSMNDPKSNIIEEWKGQNLLGFTLMQVRDEIRRNNSEEKI